MKRRFWIIGLLIVLVVGGVFTVRRNSTASSTLKTVTQDQAPAYEPTSSAAPPAAAGGAAGSTASYNDSYAEEAPAAPDAQRAGNGQTSAPFERLIIKNATIEAETDYDQLHAVIGRIEDLVKRYGGYIVSTDDSTSLNESQAYATITFRVPASRFEDAINGLQGDGIEILHRNVSGQDVTDEFVDNESRLRNLEATAGRLRELLNEAETVTDAIEVNRTLSEYEQEIEVLKGRQQYLKDSASMSLISFTVRSKYVAPEPVVAPGWSPLHTVKQAWVDLLELGKGIVDFALVLLVWTPVWLPILIAGLFLSRWLRRLWQRTTTKSAAPATPAVAAAPAPASTTPDAP